MRKIRFMFGFAAGQQERIDIRETDRNKQIRRIAPGRYGTRHTSFSCHSDERSDFCSRQHLHQCVFYLSYPLRVGYLHPEEVAHVERIHDPNAFRHDLGRCYIEIQVIKTLGDPV